MFLVVINYQHF